MSGVITCPKCGRASTAFFCECGYDLRKARGVEVATSTLPASDSDRERREAEKRGREFQSDYIKTSGQVYDDAVTSNRTQMVFLGLRLAGFVVLLFLPISKVVAGVYLVATLAHAAYRWRPT